MRTYNNDCHITETFFVIGLLTGLDVAISNQNDAIALVTFFQEQNLVIMRNNKLVLTCTCRSHTFCFSRVMPNINCVTSVPGCFTQSTIMRLCILEVVICT